MFLSKPREIAPDSGKGSFGRIPSAMRWRDGKSEYPALDQVDTRGMMKKSLEDTFDFLPTYAQDKKDVKRRMVEDAAKGENLAKDSKAHLGFLQREVKKGKDKYPGASFEDRLRMADGKWRLRQKGDAQKHARKGKEAQPEEAAVHGAVGGGLKDREDEFEDAAEDEDEPVQKVRKVHEKRGREVAEKPREAERQEDAHEETARVHGILHKPPREEPGDRDEEEYLGRHGKGGSVHRPGKTVERALVRRDHHGRFVPI